MEYVFAKLPIEINKIIYEYLYEYKTEKTKHIKKWKEFNIKNVVLFDMCYTPYYCHCFYYLSIFDFNTKPCWLCGDYYHPMKICKKYYEDTNILRRFLKIL
jgi:hypothetical protein